MTSFPVRPCLADSSEKPLWLQTNKGFFVPSKRLRIEMMELMVSDVSEDVDFD